jgi:hypothetical protein
MHASADKRAPALELVVLFLSFLAVYSFTLSDNLAAAHDSISYANVIDAGYRPGNNFFHPHHLLYNALAYLWVGACRGVGLEADSARLVSWLNAVFGSLTLCVVYLIVRRRMRQDATFALMATALPAFSFGFWFYSVSLEVYLVPLFFLMTSLYLLSSEEASFGGAVHRGREEPGTGAGTGTKIWREADARTFMAVGLTHGLAMLFHQVHLLFLGVVVLAAWRVQAGTRGRVMLARLAAYAAVAAPTVLIPYAIVIFGFQRLRTPDEIWRWLTWFAHNPAFWSPPGASGLFKAAVGFGRSIVGLHFAFAVPGVKALIERLLHGHWFMDEEFLVRNLDPRMAWVLVGLSSTLTLGVAGGLTLRLPRWRLLWRRHRTLFLLIAAWIALYTGFFFFWEPDNVEFWIPQSVCAWLLFAMIWSTAPSDAEPVAQAGAALDPLARPGWPRLNVSVMSALAALLLMLNFAGSIQFTRERDNDYYYARVSALIELARPGDLVITGREWIIGGYLERYTRARVLCLTDVYAKDSRQYLDRVRDAIERTRSAGGRVFVSEEAVHLEPETIETFGEGIRVTEALWSPFAEHWQRMDFTHNTIYVLR